MAHLRTSIAETPLDIAAAIAEVWAPDCGGVAVFIGTVRESPAVPERDDKAVVGLDYEAHPTLAEEALSALAQTAASRWDVRRIIATHRTGHCEVGEPTVVVACAAPHRGDALDACRWLIDELKATVPIWKRELYADGSSWVGANP